MENGMEKLAALGGSETSLGGIPTLCIEASCSKSFEGALRLSGEDGGPSGEWTGCEGCAGGVWKRNCCGFGNGGDIELGRKWLWMAGRMDNETRRQKFDAFSLERITEAEF